MAPPKERIPALDALRGIAILLILSRHLAWDEQRFYGGMGDLIFSAVESAWCAVSLFFVLSGFLITGILFDSKGSKSYFRTFYLRRVIRIVPLYYAVLAVSCLLLPALIPADASLQKLANDQWWLWLFSSNILIGWQHEWTFMTDWVGLGHFWTLAVEEHFYLVWPMIVLLLNRRRLMWVCAAAMAGAIFSRVWLLSHGASSVPIFVFTWCRMDSLATGAFFALALRGPHGLPAVVRPARMILPIAGLILLAFMGMNGGKLDYHQPAFAAWGYTVLAWFFGSLLIVAASAEKGSLSYKFWSWRVLKFFSKYSYGLFVFQAIPKSFFHTIFPLETLTVIFGSYRSALGVYSLLVLGTLILMAMLSWHLYEKQFLKLKRYLPYVWAKRPEPSPLVAKPAGRMIQA